MVHLNCHWASHQSQEHLPTWLAPIWHSLSTFPFYTLLYSSSRPPFYSPFSSPVTRTPLGHETTTKRLAPLSNSLSAFPFYIPLYSSSIPPPIWLALFWHSNSILFLYLLSTIYTPFLNSPSTYSSLYIVMVQLNRRWAPHWSQDNPPCMTRGLSIYYVSIFIDLYSIECILFYSV